MAMLANALESIDWSTVPGSLRPELKDYLLHGAKPSSPLLKAILLNDLRQTSSLGIEIAIPILHLLADNAPRRAWGTAHAVEEWQEMHGLDGFLNGDPPEDGPTIQVLHDQLQMAREEMKLGSDISDPERRDRVWTEAGERLARIRHRIAIKERADKMKQGLHQ